MAVINAQATLCDAIARHLLVKLRYDDDLQFRTFAPHVVYRSSTGKTLVGGTQINNPAEPLERNEPRNFDLTKIARLEVTAERFTPHPDFNRHDPRYRNGIICAINTFPINQQ